MAISPVLGKLTHIHFCGKLFLLPKILRKVVIAIFAPKKLGIIDHFCPHIYISAESCNRNFLLPKKSQSCHWYFLPNAHIIYISAELQLCGKLSFLAFLPHISTELKLMSMRLLWNVYFATKNTYNWFILMLKTNKNDQKVNEVVSIWPQRTCWRPGAGWSGQPSGHLSNKCQICT